MSNTADDGNRNVAGETVGTGVVTILSGYASSAKIPPAWS
jgi:hypothetical protein